VRSERDWKDFQDISNSIASGIKSQAHFAFYWKGIDGSTSLRAVRDELHKSQHQLNEAWSEFKRQRDRMTGQDKKEVVDELKKIQSKINEAWAEYRDGVRAAQEERRERMQAALSRFEQKLKSLYGAAARREDNISTLYERLSTTRNPDKQNQIQGWIRETEGQLADIQESIRDYESRVQDIQSKIFKY
jgi:uncharacterized coiled-coil DUF342 family protein